MPRNGRTALSAVLLMSALLFVPAKAQAASCCVVSNQPFCDDVMVAACVCAGDVFCCFTSWDSICVSEVESMGCGSCGGGNPVQGPGNCCEPHGTPGCSNPSIQNCICAFDSYCCEVEWDGICADEVEGDGCGSCSGCAPNCGGKQCGPDGCGGTCGNCQQGQNCTAWGTCESSCNPNCAGKQCGSDGCGGTCGNCPGNHTCQNGTCVSNCQPNCIGKSCGPDGCGGTCGSCGFGEVCVNSTCKNACDPDCAGKQCGSDGCGNMCGQCGGGQFCNVAGQCESVCQAQCVGKQCGPDGCGGSCGNCGFGMQCNGQGVCLGDCSKDCQGKECGDDGCGGTCGECPGDYQCSGGICLADCQTQCLGMECGPDGCGGNCGSCGFGYVCVKGGFCVDEEEAADHEPVEDPAEHDPNDEFGPEDGGDPGTDSPSGTEDQYDGVCAPGEKLWYGKCIPETAIHFDSDEEDATDGGGCAFAGSPDRTAGVGLLLLLLAALAVAFAGSLRRVSRSDNQ